ncbi:D-alanyl-D-alanine carboxypeptidase/D-alanyl-D-alanine endopeptidase [Kutzneria sp. CA-103260]|uniref:D-alanyl-D-alanine carboxypeptidase/D-alanyl-D-alanine endopeptidase n=1 Tax=Kutzneria sp. CA-103260 TaxID=2802641 RepID=UPI001BA9C213|nr:D-alanyl-D-alanine carboxypeptidase/D-alanyl-D-alanine-endopeptidase [Kutzneria sp. CA-103260]
MDIVRTSSRNIAIGCVAAVLLALPAAASAGSANASALGTDLDSLLANPELAGGQAGLVVRNADTGATLYSRLGDNLMVPASNMKLVTSATALDLLGADYTFDTLVRSTGTLSNGTLNGDLYLKGYGDPSTTLADYQAMAAQVKQAGITSVTGHLIADDSYYDSVRLGPGWAWDDEPYWYSAQVSALTVSPDANSTSGSVNVTVAPGAQGQPAVVTMTPPNTYLTVNNTATTGTSTGLSVNRVHGTNTITVSGSIAAGAAPSTEQMSVDNPTGFVASLFGKALSDAGVSVAGTTAFQKMPSGTTAVASHTSAPISQLLTPLFKQSDNLVAETLTKAAGVQRFASGSFVAGVNALTSKLAALGIDYNKYNQFDGSGLSRMDIVSPAEIAQLLINAQSRPWFQTWYNALPVAGNTNPAIGGTLANRMVGTAAANNVHAKTGSETGVSALSGYVTAADGEKLVFSLLSNNFVPGSVKDVEDAVAVRLAQYNGANDTSHAPKFAPRSQTAGKATDPRASLECSWTHSC